MGTQVNQLIELLQASLTETLKVLSVLSEAELDDPSDHPCAMGGTVRDLLTHNVDHDKMHTGQIYSARYSQRKMQKHATDRLLAETLRARTELMAALIGLPDDALEARSADDQWTMREMIEHTVYWERHSIDDLARRKLGPRVPSTGARPTWAVKDPLEGPLTSNPG